MTVKLRDITKFLCIVKLYYGEGRSSRSYVQKTFNDEPIKEARLPNYSEIENFCIELNLIETKNETIHLTKLGIKILDENKDAYIISDKLKEILARDCLLPSNLGEKILKTLSKFYISDDEKRWYPKWEVYDLFETPEILPLLYEIDLIEKKDISVEVNQKYFKLIDKSKSAKKLTQKQLENQLQNWKITGEIAEQIVLNYEKNRLKNKGCLSESENVKRISSEYANAGYDILSFNERASNLDSHDRFIEVKGSTGLEFDIHLSANEVKKAQELGNKFWLYFIGGIDVQTQKTDQMPLTIQNPFKNIFQSKNYMHECEGYRITKM